jgi:hypothetical protein
MSGETTPWYSNLAGAALVVIAVFGVPAYIIWREWNEFVSCRAAGQSFLSCVTTLMS